ncbi:MAG: hypothetical protein AAGA03_09705 [Planctomycetota bacterium]
MTTTLGSTPSSCDVVGGGRASTRLTDPAESESGFGPAAEPSIALMVNYDRWWARTTRLICRCLVPRRSVMLNHCDESDHLQNLRTLQRWACDHAWVDGQSSHVRHGDLPERPREAFSRIIDSGRYQRMLQAHHGPNYAIKSLPAINELYVTGPPAASSSDAVFYMSHLDGPYPIYPGAAVYRCMVAASENPEVWTHFPMQRGDSRQPESHRLQLGDAVAFDFHRELHYITRSAGVDTATPRVSLKLHFIAYPKVAPGYGAVLAQATTRYVLRARRLFLQTIEPKGLSGWLKTGWILRSTHWFETTHRCLGWGNLAFTGMVVVIAAVLGDLAWLVWGSSFVGHAIVMAGLISTDLIAIGSLKRDVRYHQTWAIGVCIGLAMAAENTRSPQLLISVLGVHLVLLLAIGVVRWHKRCKVTKG